MEGPFRMPDDAVVTDDLAREQAYLENARRELAPDARADPVGPSVQGGDRRLRRVPRRDPAPARRVARRRPATTAVLRPRPTTTSTAGALVHRPPARRRRRRRPGGRRLARRRLDAPSTGPRATEPMGVVLRRRFGVDRGAHHRLRGRAPHRPRRARRGRSQILAEEIERPRVGPMRDIVATIQPEQDEIVRADAATTVCVQGAPGHRQDRGRPAPRGVAALRLPRPAGPLRRARRRSEPRVPRAHRRRAAGPRRGRRSATHGRGASVAGRRRRSRGASDAHRRSPSSRATRGWPRCCDRAVWAHVAAPTEPLVRAARRRASGGSPPTR